MLAICLLALFYTFGMCEVVRSFCFVFVVVVVVVVFIVPLIVFHFTLTSRLWHHYKPIVQ